MIEMNTGFVGRVMKNGRADVGIGPGVHGFAPTLDLPPEAELHGPVVLRIESGTYGVDPIAVTLAPGASIEIGSGGAAGAQIVEPTVSARHCRATHTGSAVEIADLGARNGVRVGGVLVSRALLPLGGTCELGRAWLRVMPLPRAKDVEGPPLRGLVGSSPPMRALAATARRFAELRLPVLVRGESGTGKDLVARALHAESARAKLPFVIINAATISRELAESELFGHCRGAFTGAVRDRRGAFREAEGGTLFLDEIGSVSLEVQAKLLRAVEEGVVRPVGGERSSPIDVRLIAATCEPLETLVAERRFRADLYERLAVCVIQVPPLRERPDDVPALARHLLAASELGERTLSASALAVLRAQRWTGNVRELRNVVVQAAVRAGDVIEAEHVAEVIAERTPPRRRIAIGEALRIFEEVGRNVSEAARRADVPRTTMRDLLRSAGVAAWPRSARGGEG